MSSPSSLTLDYFQTTPLLHQTSPDVTPSLLSLLRISLPFLKLPSSTIDTPYHATTRRLLSQLLAQLHLQTSHPLHLPPSQTDDISILLAQAAATDVEELVEIWNEMAPPQFRADDSATLASQIHNLRSETCQMQQQVANLHVDLRQVRSEACRLKTLAFEKVLEAVELDVSERTSPQSAHRAKVKSLAAKGNATSGKLKLLQNEIEAEVYNDENVLILKRVKQELERRQDERKLRQEQAERKLAAYRAGGPELEQIVSETLRLRRELEQKKWEREELLRK